MGGGSHGPGWAGGGAWREGRGCPGGLRGTEEKGRPRSEPAPIGTGSGRRRPLPQPLPLRGPAWGRPQNRNRAVGSFLGRPPPAPTFRKGRFPCRPREKWQPGGLRRDHGASGLGGSCGGRGGPEASQAPWGEGPSPWDPDAAGAGPGEMRLLPKPGTPGPTTLCPQCPLCKRVGWQQRPQSPAQRGGPPHVRRAHFLPRAEGGPTRGPGASNPGGMAAPPPSPSVSLRLRELGLKYQLLWGHPALCPTNGPSPKSRPLLRGRRSAGPP